ncbi:MAG: WbqC family protein [Candidatus Cloacimonetes bacterium]|nr:WbqC family protein [Candidatus Cloacimonadota bacterium]
MTDNIIKQVAIHQPECLPWIGFFNKMMLAQQYIILDDVQYCRRNFQHRNQIQVNNDKVFLTLPVHCPLKSIIKDVKLSNDTYIQKHINTIERAYKKDEFFSEFFPLLKSLYQKKHKFLLDFNMQFITSIRDYLNIKTPLFFSSSFNLKSTKTSRIIDLVKCVEGNSYITGVVSLDYLDPEQFENEQIDLKIHTTKPLYSNKRNKKFISHLSIIDLLMQYSPADAKRIILHSGTSIEYNAYSTDR